ncbi:MAG: endonuclease/exonuclease/phosphatase family protein [Chromatiales bacterium]|nr:endonuclease/exonuclease/phosphatase family protein [Chromatiales bacterium]
MTLAASDVGGHRLRLLSYNIQVGISSTLPHHYLTKSWKHLFQARRRFENLDHIARLLHGYDIVGLQELDAGSYRTGYVDLTEYLARRADYPFWYHQLNRNYGPLAQHGNGFLSRLRPTEVTEHRLPSLIPGRGAMVARFGSGEASLAVIFVHLSLSTRARRNQLAFIAELANASRHVVVMGDMNCSPDSVEMRQLFRTTGLREPQEELRTFPSWRPKHHIDHILVSESLRVNRCHAINHAHSDHLPIAMEVSLPPDLHLE